MNSYTWAEPSFFNKLEDAIRKLLGLKVKVRKAGYFDIDTDITYQDLAILKGAQPDVHDTMFIYKGAQVGMDPSVSLTHDGREAAFQKAEQRTQEFCERRSHAY